jgi:hypothetical protein
LEIESSKEKRKHMRGGGIEENESSKSSTDDLGLPTKMVIMIKWNTRNKVRKLGFATMMKL